MKTVTSKVTNIPEGYWTVTINSGFLFALQIIQRISGLATTYFLVRYLSQDDFGAYHFILTTVAILTSLVFPGLNSAVLQSVARGFTGTARKALSLMLKGSIAASLVLAGAAFYYYFIESSIQMASGFMIAAVIFPLSNAMTVWKSILAGREEFGKSLKVEGFGAMAGSAMIIASTLLFPGNLFIPLALTLGVLAILNIFMTVKTVIPASGSEEEGCIVYGKKISLYIAVNIVAMHIDKMLLYLFLSPSALAIYIAAQKIPELTKGALQNLAAALMPRFARHEKYTRRIDRAMNIFSLVFGIAILIFAFTLLPWMIEIIFGEEYLSAIPYSQALVCSLIIGQLARLRMTFVRSRMDDRSFRDFTLAMSVTRISLALVLIPFFGITGAVITVFAGRIASSIMAFTIMRKRYSFE
jgi:O-antigen/teichoic acid export membrane protein